MDYEKKYKKALERARITHHNEDDYAKAVLESVFPELKESDDEKIRKELLAFIKREGQHIDKYKWHKWLAWLEKQGEQETLCGKCRKEQPSHSCQDITALGRCAVEHEQKPAKDKGMNLKEEEMTPFQKEVFYIIDTNIEAERGLKQECDKLLALASNEIEQKPSWSDVDEENFQHACGAIGAADYYTYEDKQDLEKWLKSLKERYTWKPSEEQLKALEYQVNTTHKGSWQYKASKDLLEQLKKL